MNAAELSRFMSYVKKRSDGCWEWIGGRTGAGYGAFKIRGNQYRAHRVIYEHHNGPVGDLLVCHKCDQRWCVRPAHLFSGTHKDNTRDCIQKGRMWQLYDEELHRARGIKLRGRPAPNRGVSPSKKTKQKISRALRGQRRTFEQRLNYSAAAKKRETLFKKQGRVRNRDSQGMFL